MRTFGETELISVNKTLFLGVFVNTGIEYDASDAGATPSEAISWGKLQLDSNHVKVFSEFTLVLPILVAETFVKHKELATKL
jgi:deoxyhypusine synthase